MLVDEITPPRKRARTAAIGDDSQPEALKRDEDFWYYYDDSSTIILRVIAAGANVEFRVYRGPLAKHSPVFRDMLSFPQPPKENSTGSVSNSSSDCPVVRLTDSPNDLRHLLWVFMASDSLEPFGVSNPTFDALSAWIRLAHKYQIDQLLEDALAYFRWFYPNPLRDPRWRDTWSTTRCLVPKDRPTTISGSYAIGVVNLARLTESDDLLPLPLLECCKLGVEITQGFVRDGAREYLSPEDLGRCFAAKATLMWTNIEACLRIFALACVDYEAIDECHDQSRCGKLLENYRHLSYYHVQFLWVDSLLAEGQVWKYRSPQLCPNCLSYVDKLVANQRHRFWNSLSRVLRVDESGLGSMIWTEF